MKIFFFVIITHQPVFTTVSCEKLETKSEQEKRIFHAKAFNTLVIFKHVQSVVSADEIACSQRTRHGRAESLVANSSVDAMYTYFRANAYVQLHSHYERFFR